MVRQLLVIEDGHEYEEFAQLFLADAFEIRAAHSAAEALSALEQDEADALLVDLRFDRAPADTLVGDLDEMSRRRFGGDRHRALRHLMDQQGTLILGALRAAGHDARAVFVHDFPPQRLTNLCRLYGDVRAVSGFDAAALREVLGAESA